MFSAHLRAAKDADTAAILARSHDILRNEFNFAFSTLQVETEDLAEEHATDLDFLFMEAMQKEQ